MMIEMNRKLQNVFDTTTDQEKIRLFYELGKYFLANSIPDEGEEMDEDMENLFDDIANVIQDIDNL